MTTTTDTTKTVEWRIYYDNGRVFNSSEGNPSDAPAFGIIAIVNKKRFILNNFDWYYWHKEQGEWWASDLHGLLDLLLHNKPIEAIKQGRNVDNETYRRIISEATKYCEI